MTDDITKRYYEVRLLNDDLAKSHDDQLLGTDVKVSPSGVLEFNQIFTDSDTMSKVFFSGHFFVKEMARSDYEELRKMNECDHDHDENEE